MSYNLEIFEDILGQTLTDIQRDGDDEITFVTANGDKWRMYHQQDCCECVLIEDVVGDLDDLIGHPLVEAEEVSADRPLDMPSEEVMWLTLTDQLDTGGDESNTWTFYKFRTCKGSVTIRWLGSSNGYYSESVSFHKI